VIVEKFLLNFANFSEFCQTEVFLAGKKMHWEGKILPNKKLIFLHQEFQIWVRLITYSCGFVFNFELSFVIYHQPKNKSHEILFIVCGAPAGKKHFIYLGFHRVFLNFCIAGSVANPNDFRSDPDPDPTFENVRIRFRILT
jgi:hypothetical protein